jgi:uncharacterized protein YndB with AHSA1/START domain
VTKLFEAPAETGRQTVVLERAFDAPRDLVFRVFTDPVHLARWWVPYPLTCAVMEFDARPGGSLRFVMQASKDLLFPYRGKVLEIDPPNLLVFITEEDLDDAGLPHTKVLQTINFSEREGKTVVRLQIEVLEACETTPETLRGMTGGWMQDFGRLQFYLLSMTGKDDSMPAVTTPSDREIVVTRTFDSPRVPIFHALTDPAIIPNWWSPRDQTTTVETMDVQPHGQWCFRQQNPAGKPAEYRGEYVRVDAPELVVTSLESGPTTGMDVMNAIYLHERDAALNAGLASDAIESYARLADALS